MFERLKAAAASVWGFVKSMATDSIRQLEDELEHEIVRLSGELDQSRRACIYLENAYQEQNEDLTKMKRSIEHKNIAHKAAVDSWVTTCNSLTEQRDTLSKNLERYRLEIERLKKTVRNCDKRIASLTRQTGEDAIRIEVINDSHNARNRDIDELRETIATQERTIERQSMQLGRLKFLASDSDANKKAVRVLTEERDGFMRESAVWQDRYAKLAETMQAVKLVIEGQQETPLTGDTSATGGVEGKSWCDQCGEGA